MSSFVSPIIEYPSAISNCRLFVKREDLIPFSFGGNKYRIASEFFKDMISKECNCIIGYGNMQSNLCRVIANMASSKDIPCYLITPILDDVPKQLSSNRRIAILCNAHIRPCSILNVSDTVESVIMECKAKGLKPYYINGDKYGRGNERVQLEAYYQTYWEIKEQMRSLGCKIDYIFLATGTGMTQGGLLAGRMAFGGDERIIGISIARSQKQEKAVIHTMLNAFFGHTIEYDVDIVVDDSFLCGGYGRYDDNVSNTINRMQVKYGLPLDPTYTGKAYAGMESYIKEQDLSGNILFIHTGGTPLFFDNIY